MGYRSNMNNILVWTMYERYGFAWTYGFVWTKVLISHSIVGKVSMIDRYQKYVAITNGIRYPTYYNILVYQYISIIPLNIP